MFAKLKKDFKSLGIGAALGGLALVGAAAFVVIRRKRQRLMPMAMFTDLAGAMAGAEEGLAVSSAGPSGLPGLPRQISKRKRATVSDGGTGPEAQGLISRPGASGTSGAEPTPLDISPRSRAALAGSSAGTPTPSGGLRSLKNILSGKWGLRVSRGGSNDEGMESEDAMVLPGAVATPTGRSTGPGVPIWQSLRDDNSQIVGSPKVRPSIASRDSLRQRYGQQQQQVEMGEGLTPHDTAIGVAGSAAAGGGPMGSTSPPQGAPPGPPLEARGRRRLPAIEGRTNVHNA